MNDPKQVKKFLRLERVVDDAYRYIESQYANLETCIDQGHYESAYDIVSSIRKNITLIRNTRVKLDAVDIDVSELPNA